MQFRVGAASTATLAETLSPMIVTLSVKFVSPCYGAVLQENGGVTTPLVMTVAPAPYPSPLIEPITDFPYDLQGTVDCGP